MRIRLALAIACAALGGCLKLDDWTPDAAAPRCVPRTPLLRLARDFDHPIAVGTTIHAPSTRATSTPGILDTITVTSSDPSVLEVSTPDTSSYSITAMGIGAADLVFAFSDGSTDVTRSFVVSDVTSFATYSELALLSRSGEQAARVDEPRVVVGSSTRLYVVPMHHAEWMAFDTVVLRVGGPSDGNSVSRLDWPTSFEVEVSAPRLGSQVVRAEYVHDPLFPEAPFDVDVAVRGVEGSSISTLQLLSDDDVEVQDGTCVTVVAWPRDALGELVHGGRVRFLELRSDHSLGQGDAVSYVVRHDARGRLRASVGHASAELPIHAQNVSAARVAGDSSGCNVGHPARSSPVLAVSLLASMAVRVLGRRSRNKRDSTC